MNFEPYEFLIVNPYVGGFVLVYRCWRGKCRGRTVWVSDRNTHNQYHNGVENMESNTGLTGLEDRYSVQRLNDATGKHKNCLYFVLDPQHDPLAVEALRVYARLTREAGNVALADDLDEWVGE